MAHDPIGTTDEINKERINSGFFLNKLRAKNLEVKNTFEKQYPHVKKILDEKGIDLARLRDHSARVVASGAITGSLLFSPPLITTDFPLPGEVVRNLGYFNSQADAIPLNQLVINQIRNFLPARVGPLTRSQEKNIEKIIQESMEIPVRATLEGEHLNTTYGYIGAEQHLMRYPGDVIGNHDLMPDDEGMAPGKGAWGYFANSKSKLTRTDIEREKWYGVVQTLYLPDWEMRLKYLIKWYKYRKILIVNTINGNAVVADIADSGPAAFTGKHFGGSPEVMNYLGGSRYKKGPVIVLFVDDPENKVPLGPVEYNKEGIEKKSLVHL